MIEFERFAAVRRFGQVKYSPDGTRFAYIVDTSGYANLWVQPVGGGFPKQITALAKRRVNGFEWSPRGDRIAFLSDLDGDEMYQVFVVDADGGWPRQLTDNPGAQYDLSDWHPDGRRIAITGNDRDPSQMDPQLLDVDTGEVERLHQGGLFYSAQISPDGRRLLVVEFRSNTDQDIHVIDLETGRMTLATEHEGDAIFLPAAWTKDGGGFYLRTNHGRDFTALAAYSLERGAWNYIHAPEHDLEGFQLARDGRTTVAVVNVDGSSQLQAYDMTTGAEIPVPSLPLGMIVSLSLHPSRRRVAMVFSRPTEAGNVYEFELSSGRLEAREQSMLGGIRPEQLRDPVPVRYPSFDRDVPAWLYLPEGPGPFPVLLSIHGGPEDQERPAYIYSGLYQYLLERGIAVMAPNIRGSTGYGIGYQKLIHRDWGGAELEDIRHAAEYLRSQPWADPDRLAIFGGSFGGFATLSAIARLPEYWAAAVDVVGPSNLITFVKSVPPHWRAMLRAWVGDADEDREFLVARSPITHVDAIRAPLLVIQGANDPRVVKAESDQMVERLRSLGREVEYYVDEESGHGPASQEAALRWWKMTADFLVERLTPQSEAGSAR